MNHNARIAIVYLIVVLFLLGAILWDLTGVPGRGWTTSINRGQVQAVVPTHAGEKAGPIAGPAGMQAAPAPTENAGAPRGSETVTSPGLQSAPRATPAS